jgi:hypothetical protein
LPLDAIFTWDNLDDPLVGIAFKAGFGIGARSGKDKVEKDALIARWSWRFSLTFIDNQYHAYDHGRHRDAVARHRPKYATVRDIMSREQCEAAGIPFYSFDQIMRWAEEIEKYAENVIVIPKFDCIMDIPGRFVLGYSVPSSHGATPLSAERFRGRRVHLLGGSWKMQLGYLALLGDDVVSFDTNWVAKVAQYGQFAHADGRMGALGEDAGFAGNNPYYVAAAMSFGNIGQAVYDLHHGVSDAMKPDAIQAPPEESADDDDRR